ncbi:MAG: trypsin-like peptidase domain-containing protein [Anaerolineae bacterium]
MKLLSLSALIVLAACNLTQQATPPPQSILSTPVADLPVNASSRSPAEQTQPTAVPQSVIDEADAEYILLTNVYERLLPSVVNVEVLTSPSATGFHDAARGSGFIYDDNGHVITNAHVANDTISVTVTFYDGYVAEASVVGVDLFSDLAVLKIDVDAARLYPVTFADSDQIHVGQRAIAIGNPFGLASSMTVGIVSGLGRQLPSAEMISNDVTPNFNNPSIIQVDADINPGNSGGPLLNSRGEVIGVNTAIRTESGVFEGVGFSVPANTVLRVVPELIEKGKVEYSWLGISTMSAEDGLGVAALAEPLQLPVKQGVLIDEVTPDSPADEAGLLGGNRSTRVRGQPVCAGGDIIVAINGVYIASMDELMSYLVVNTHPGDTVTVLTVRGDQTFELPVTLRARPDQISTEPRPCG